MMFQMLVSVFLTALPAPGDAAELGDEFTAEPGEAADPGDEFTEEPNETRNWECVVPDESGATYSWEEGEVEIYCLAYCEGFYEYRRAWQRAVDPVDKQEGWCRSKAKKYCHRYNLDYVDSCYGERY